MPEFKAYFYDEYVCIGGQAYRSNETLTACLGLDGQELNDCLVRLWRLAPSARLKVVSAEQLRSFLSCLQQTHEVLLRLSGLLASLPPLRNGVLPPAERLLPGLLDRLCSDGGAANVEIDDLFYFTDFYFLRIASRLTRLSGGEAAYEMDLLNSGIAGLFDMYISLAGDILQARRIYSELLDKYIHQRRSFTGGGQLADCLSRYRRDSENSGRRERLPDGFRVKSAYEPFTDVNGQPHLALSCTFERLRDFLYVDFFRGLERSHLPRRCDNCGRYFLLAGGKYSCYCGLPLPGEPGKSCRDIGAKKRFGSKCKTDPVWLAYNRAYKAHYARCMRGKMSGEDFESWTRRAVALRDQAASGELSAEQYEQLIRDTFS